MQDPGPFLLGSHKGGYGTVRKGEGTRGPQEGRSARKTGGRSPVALKTRPERSHEW